jgi:two-component system sensor histidine kinase RpfC
MDSFKSERPSRRQPLRLADKKVLIVSADQSEREQLSAHLQGWGIRVEEASNALDGLVRLRLAQDDAQPFDLVLFSSRGHRVLGEQFAVLMRSDPGLARLRLIHLGQPAGAPKEAALRQCGFVAFLPTPLDKTLLFDALHQALGNEPTRNGVARLVDRYLSLGRYTAPLEILLAEPDPTQRRRAREALKRSGHHLFEVENGEQTLEALSEHTFDMVLIDLRLPGIGGIEAVRLFHFSRSPENWPAFVVLAQHPSAEELRECRRLDIAAIIHKPIQPQALAQTVATAARDSGGDPSEIYGRRMEHASESALPIMDEHNLTELERLGESPTFLSELIGEFLDQIDASLSEALKARGSPDGFARFLELGHTLKDIAGNLGALRLYELGLTASQLPEQIYEREGEQLLSRIELAFGQTRATLFRHLEHHGVRNDPRG